ncbi:MAG: hypothetical protein H6574_04135 [Lewinellaceae bacterium]|nr:hypothetical protein [Saprospiraceae bacterium]MCB9330250.1 hypothetical protein [Lewinellaceae bacterium]
MLEHNEPLDQEIHHDQENNVPLPVGSYSTLAQTATWAKILAITNFSSAGLQLIGMFVVLDRVRLMLRYLNGGSNYILLMILVYLILISFTALIGWHLWNYAGRLKSALLYEDTDDLDLAYYYQFRYFKTLGWLVISGLILMVAGLLLFIYLRAMIGPYG